MMEGYDETLTEREIRASRGDVAPARDGRRAAPLPRKIHDHLQAFLLDSKTGNLTVNIRGGQILGYRLEEVVSLKAD